MNIEFKKKAQNKNISFFFYAENDDKKKYIFIIQNFFEKMKLWSHQIMRLQLKNYSL